MNEMNVTKRRFCIESNPLYDDAHPRYDILNRRGLDRIKLQ